VLTPLALMLAGCEMSPPSPLATLIVVQEERYLSNVPCGSSCVSTTFDDAVCDYRASAIVFGGHSIPPVYYNQHLSMVIDMVACTHAELVVLDTCYGFSEPMLSALASKVPGVMVVGTTSKLPPRGLLYSDGFETGTIEQRTAMIRMPDGSHPQYWRANMADIDAINLIASHADLNYLYANLQRKAPNLVRFPLGVTATALVEVPSARFKDLKALP